VVKSYEDISRFITLFLKNLERLS